MDNLTHTLVGAVAAESALSYIQFKKLPSPNRKVLYAASLIGNNLPDIDILWANSLTSGKLGYLLHHRGHTHTALFAIVLATLLFLIVQKTKFSRRLEPVTRGWALRLFAIGLFLHMALDSLNSYGVHLLWPIDNHWYYGDSVFIIEPIFWIVLCPYLIVASTHLLWRLLWGLVSILGVGLYFYFGNNFALAFFLLLTFLTLTFLFFRIQSPLYRTQIIGLVAMGSLSAFAFTSILLKYNIRSTLQGQNNGIELIDLIQSPFPANPLCWNLLAITRRENQLQMQSGFFSFYNETKATAHCKLPYEADKSVLSSEGWYKNSKHLFWNGAYQADVGALRTLTETSCTMRGFLQFARAPFWLQSPKGIVLGDLRFKRSTKMGFSEIFVERNDSQCPQNLPPWIPPRLDLLENSWHKH